MAAIVVMLLPLGPKDVPGAIVKAKKTVRNCQVTRDLGTCLCFAFTVAVAVASVIASAFCRILDGRKVHQL